MPLCVILSHSVHKMAQKGTERVNKNAQNNNKGTKQHKMTQNESEKAKNSTELLKRLTLFHLGSGMTYSPGGWG